MAEGAGPDYLALACAITKEAAPGFAHFEAWETTSGRMRPTRNKSG